MKIKLLFFIFIFSSILLSQVQQQPKYSVDDVMKKLEAIDNSLSEKVNSLRDEFDQKLNQSVNRVREDLSSKIEKIDSRVSIISNETGQVLKRISNVEAQNRGLMERISNVDAGLTAVKKSTDGISSGIKDISAKIDESNTKFDVVLSKIGSNKTAIVLGFIIVIILASVVAVGVFNLSKLTKSVEKNILDSFEGTAGKIEVTTGDLKTLVDVLKQQTSEIVAYQRILEERITSAQQQIEARIEEKLPARRRTQRKSSSPEE